MKNTKIVWTDNFAYAVGLFTADGSMSKDGRHFDFTSKDKDQVINFAKCLNLNNKISGKSRGYSGEKKYFHIQFGDVKLYKFFQSIGLQPNKSLTIKEVNIPDQFFPDFLRGYLDGDGSVQLFEHPQSELKQIRIRFYSGSKQFILWLRSKIKTKVKVSGGSAKERVRAWWLVYCKRDSLELIKYMYYSDKIPMLKRKAVVALNYYQANSNIFKPNRWQNRFTIKV